MVLSRRVVGAGLCVIAIALTAGLAQTGTMAMPPFSNTSGTVFDIITTSDPSTFVCLESLAQAPRQIWDKRVEDEPVVEAHLFLARYADGAAIEIASNPEFDAATAEALALRFAFPLGQLPGSLRAGIKRFSIHGGDESFHAGTGGIIVYSEKADQRASYAHLEESLFHEAVHASWDQAHRLAPEWQAAQAADGGFLTDYAAERPDREDLAETALFAYAVLYYPDRMPPADTEDIWRAVPNRIAYIKNLLDQDMSPAPRAEVPGTCATED